MQDPRFSSLSGRWPESDWIAELGRIAEECWRDHPHGDLPRWRATVEALPTTEPLADLDRVAPRLGTPIEDDTRLRELLMEFHPWRKGPLNFAGVHIETEWRSDRKWDRVAPHVDLANQRVLDIGCGNGYFGLRMLGAGAELVIGIDPTPLFVMQYLASRHFSGELPHYVLPLGIEDLPSGGPGFDTVFSMGVLYHRRDHIEHLERIRSLLRPGGTMVLETLVLPPERPRDVLVPSGRYARMGNVHAVPGTERLKEWVVSAGFEKAEVVDVSATTTSEQRSTEWMRFESLEQALDSGDLCLTVEGHPAPIRAVLIAEQ